MIGRRIGPYELLGKLGGGGMGEVFLAHRVGAAGVGRPVVLKIVHRRHARSEKLRAMFLDEARLAAAVHHPNVARVEDLGEADDELFMVIEHVPGASLAQLLGKLESLGRRLLPAAIVAILADAAAGLHAAHEARDEHGRPLNLVHRDVSPHNLLLGTQGQVKVIDFGVAKAERRLQRTTGKQIKGKLRYMAAEQLEGTAERRSDVFALGVILWEMLAGRRLFDDADEAVVIRRVLAGDIPAPSELVAVSPALEAVAMKALARRPEARFDTAEALHDALHDAIPTHVEVDAVQRAALVLGLLGPEIDDRSRRVGLPLVSAFDTSELAVEPSRALQRWTEALPAAAPRPPTTAPQVAAAAPQVAALAPAPVASSRRTALPIAIALALGAFAAGLGVVIAFLPSGPPPHPTTTSVPAEPTPSAGAATPSQVEPPADADAGPVATPTSETNVPARPQAPATSAAMEAPSMDAPAPTGRAKSRRDSFPIADVEDPFADEL